MADKIAKGIHDPWRIHSPDWKPPDDEAPVGAVGSKHPMDKDLVPHSEFMLRPKGTDSKLLVYGAQNAKEAVENILAAIRKDNQLRTTLIEAGFQFGAKGSVMLKGFHFVGETHVLAYPEADSTADGFHKFTAVLRRANRDLPGFQQRLTKLGLVPLL